MSNKSYPQFNLNTLQLPIPAEAMSKEEYKVAFGIDLDNIDLTKVTLLWRGKDKFYVDEIKETEDGYKIFADGKVVAIGEDEVTITEDAYSVENSKPVYCHPIIVFQSSGSTILSLGLLIFNQDSTPLNSYDALKTEFERIRVSTGSSANIIATGKVKDSDNELTVSHIYVTSSSLRVYGLLATNLYGNIDITSITPTVVDGVNKIN